MRKLVKKALSSLRTTTSSAVLLFLVELAILHVYRCSFFFGPQMPSSHSTIVSFTYLELSSRPFWSPVRTISFTWSCMTAFVIILSTVPFLWMDYFLWTSFSFFTFSSKQVVTAVDRSWWCFELCICMPMKVSTSAAKRLNSAAMRNHIAKAAGFWVKTLKPPWIVVVCSRVQLHDLVLFAQNGIVDILVPLQEFFMQSRITWFELLHLSKVEWCHSDIVKSIKWRGIPAQGLKWFQMKLLVALSSGTKEHSYTSYKLHVVIGKLNVRILGINLLLKLSSFS